MTDPTVSINKETDNSYTITFTAASKEWLNEVAAALGKYSWALGKAKPIGTKILAAIKATVK